jgi:hypothetical protein
MINQGRATHYPTLTVKFTGRYRAADRLGQPSQAVDASSANQSALANCETRETQCQLLERVIDIPRTCSSSGASGTQRCLLQASRTTPCANATVHVTQIGQWLFARIGSAVKNSARQKRSAAWRSRPSDAARPPRGTKVSREVSRLRCSASDRKLTCGDHDPAPIGAHVVPAAWQAGGACALTRDQSVASAAHALYQRSRANRAGQ